VTSEGGETGSEPTSPRRFGQLPDLVVPDDVDEPLPEDDWPIDVEDLSEALRESEADIAAGRTFSEEQIRARYDVPRSDTGSAEQETAYLLRSPENARRLMEAIARDTAGGE
jgi:PHD/YefM family antitoxin component YafN of YafNO toxin-antitoxin module